MNIAFNIPTYTIDKETFPKPLNGNYDYWVALVAPFLAKSNTIEIHCWNDERGIMEAVTSLPKQAFHIIKEDNLTIFKGSKTPSLSKYLLKNFRDENGNFKWFTVNLIKDQVAIFHSGHWATEFFLPNLLEEEVRFIKSVTPVDTSLIQF
ncbi:hypothetical protein OEV98_06085 [Caldibacillus lycopersici]|uniref:Uncharacterized protein n=1 Tax=Perspicuibacillus lycopersici TaxID=1325689 RepID=A0AAE3LQ67_9BACI|nr:hypothetical protein [Perspicuibacillus lycopersici]MCU9613119.1 hypothetical protein [Perspicuibacillus lycopersici]